MHLISPWNRKRGLSKPRFDQNRIVGHIWRMQENKQTAFSTLILCVWRDATNCRCVYLFVRPLVECRLLRKALLTTQNPPKHAQPWEGLLGMQTSGCLYSNQQSLTAWWTQGRGLFLSKRNRSYLLLWETDYSLTSRANSFWRVVSDTGGGQSWEKPVSSSITSSHTCLHSRCLPITDVPSSKVSAW